MAGANRLYWPRRGSMQIWPRKRTKRQYPAVTNWVTIDATKLLGFIGYKAGMTHLMLRDNRPTSVTKNQTIAFPATIIECPPLKPVSLRFYQDSVYGMKLISELFSSKLDKKVKVHKKQGNEIKDFTELRLVIHTQPKLLGKVKKEPDLLELSISGKTNEEKLAFGKQLLEKDGIKIADTFKDGQYVDIHGVTKGKGFQGTVKRFGVKIRQHKSEKVKRGVGTLGPWTPKHVLFSVGQPGKMGYHARVEYNKWIMKISSDGKEINPKDGFVNYGYVKNDYILLKGSIPGPVKRAVVLTEPIKPQYKPERAEIQYISLRSKQ